MSKLIEAVEAVEAEQKAEFELNSKEFWWNAGLQKAIVLIGSDAF